MAETPATARRSWSVLLLAYGGPRSIDDVEPFLRRIMRPTAPSPELVARAVERYRAIGGGSPLVDNTLRQAEALRHHLGTYGRSTDARGASRCEVGPGVFVGMRHSAPWIGEGLGEALARGGDRVVVVIMASHQSSRATGGYHTDVEAALGERSERGETAGSLVYVAPWHTSAGYLDAVADRARTALAELSGTEADAPLVLFSAHSLPLVAGAGDPEYERALFDTARGVMARLPDHAWRVAYQSRSGRPGMEWLGPGVEEVLTEETGRGRRRVAVVPLGFVVEHLETLYDLDIALGEECDRLGLQMTRAATVGDHPMFMATLAEGVRRAAVGAGWEGLPGREAT